MAEQPSDAQLDRWEAILRRETEQGMWVMLMRVDSALDVLAAVRQARQERDQAVAEVETLRAELQDQWESNHFEHCGGDWPHPQGKTCLWPLPTILGTPVLDNHG